MRSRVDRIVGLPDVAPLRPARNVKSSFLGPRARDQVDESRPAQLGCPLHRDARRGASQTVGQSRLPRGSLSGIFPSASSQSSTWSKSNSAPEGASTVGRGKVSFRALQFETAEGPTPAISAISAMLKRSGVRPVAGHQAASPKVGNAITRSVLMTMCFFAATSSRLLSEPRRLTTVTSAP